MNELSALIQDARDSLNAIADAGEITGNAVVTEMPRFSGQLRASVRMGLNAPELDVVIAPIYEFDAIPDAEQISKSKLSSSAKKYKHGDVIYISSNLDYAWIQEREAGHLMFTKAAAGFQNALDKSFA